MSNGITLLESPDGSMVYDKFQKVLNLANVLDPVSLASLYQVCGKTDSPDEYKSVLYSRQTLIDYARIQDNKQWNTFSIVVPDYRIFQTVMRVNGTIATSILHMAELYGEDAVFDVTKEISDFVFKLSNALDIKDLLTTCREQSDRAQQGV